MACLAPPKAPSSLIKVSRWSLLGLGIFFGAKRQKVLAARENAIREKEEQERPAREAASKAEKDRLNREELAYLARETGVANKDSKLDTPYKSECGCSY